MILIPRLDVGHVPSTDLTTLIPPLGLDPVGIGHELSTNVIPRPKSHQNWVKPTS